MVDFQCLVVRENFKASAAWLYFLIVSETKQVLSCLLSFFVFLSYFLFFFLYLESLIDCVRRLPGIVSNGMWCF